MLTLTLARGAGLARLIRNALDGDPFAIGALVVVALIMATIFFLRRRR